MRTNVVRFAPAGSYAGEPPPSGGKGKAKGPAKKTADFPFLVEVWTDKGDAVDEVLAQARHAALGWASYYAAVTTFPSRKVTLRLEGRILANSTFPK